MRQPNPIERVIAAIINGVMAVTFANAIPFMAEYFGRNASLIVFMGFNIWYLVLSGFVFIYILICYKIRGSPGYIVTGLIVKNIGDDDALSFKRFGTRSIPFCLFYIGFAGTSLDVIGRMKAYVYSYSIILGIIFIAISCVSVLITGNRSIIDYVSKTEIVKCSQIFKRRRAQG